MASFEMEPEHFDLVAGHVSANPPDGPVVFEADDAGQITVRWRSGDKPASVSPALDVDPERLR
jgi:hypothetical protein